MTKEYTGPEFEIEFARAWLAYLEAGKIGVDPKENWEIHDDMEKWLKSFGWPQFAPESRYRWKPATKRKQWVG